MRLHSLKLEGFRQHLETEVLFSDATFLLGQNNIGKSSILVALGILLNDHKTIAEEEYCHAWSKDSQSNQRLVNRIILTADFRNLPSEALTWRGFKGRVLRYQPDDPEKETGLRIVYRKIFSLGQPVEVQLKVFKTTKKAEYATCKKPTELIERGVERAIVEAVFGPAALDKNFSAKQDEQLRQIDELWDVDETVEEWFTNPGGIPGVVLEKLPKFLLIPAQDRVDEITGSSGTLLSTLNELFSDVRDASENYSKAKEYLDRLALELDPTTEGSDFGVMMADLNGVLDTVFPESKIFASASLSDPNKVLKPAFSITMSSNIVTPVGLQGTGMIRAAVFALLRYRKSYDNKRLAKDGKSVRPLIIGFEEPEIYLHPHAANQMRDVIYELAASGRNQIVCTTHSPYMIDLTKDGGQILNHLRLEQATEVEVDGQRYPVDPVKAFPFNISAAFRRLVEDERDYVKMIMKIDDHMARVFFAKHVLIVEGDTEDIVLRETIRRLPEKVRKDVTYNWQIVKARGKAAIIALVRYLNALEIPVKVIHDEDSQTAGAARFNASILEVVGDESRRVMLKDCIEDVLGYPPPKSEKPSRAYHLCKAWGGDWKDVPEGWRQIVETIFQPSFDAAGH